MLHRGRRGPENGTEAVQGMVEAIIDLGRAVTKAVAERTAACIQREENHYVLCGTPLNLGFRLHDRRGDKSRKTVTNRAFLPLRPVLLGGDDITCLCDGRIALDLAETALKEFARHPVPHLGPDGEETSLTACAGVALVKAHAPVHRSYELAEDLRFVENEKVKTIGGRERCHGTALPLPWDDQGLEYDQVEPGWRG